MNRKYIEENDVIDRYLLHQLSEEELRDFSLEMMQDPSLQAEVEEARVVMKTLWKTRRTKRAKKKFRWLPIVFIFSILLLGLLGYTLFQSPKNFSIDQISNPEENMDSPELPTSEKRETKLQEQIETENENPPNDLPAKNTLEQQNPSKEKKASPKKAIAADFSPNTLLESWIGTGVRSNEYSFFLSKPVSDSKMNRVAGKVDFQVAGEVESPESEIVAYFQVHLFSNQEEDYKKFKSLYSWDLEFEEKEGKFHFNIEENLELEPGLYYYLIRDEDTGMKHVVGKMRVE